jgi:hypothetical protein
VAAVERLDLTGLVVPVARLLYRALLAVAAVAVALTEVRWEQLVLVPSGVLVVIAEEVLQVPVDLGVRPQMETLVE